MVKLLDKYFVANTQKNHFEGLRFESCFIKKKLDFNKLKKKGEISVVMMLDSIVKNKKLKMRD